MRDELISFETAVLAKEKGYSLPITKYSEKYYNKEGKFQEVSYKSTVNLDNGELECPSQSLLQRWLREVHGILVISIPWKDHGDDVNDAYRFRPMIVSIKTWEEFSTYELALEKGLQEGLKLIK